MAKLAYSDNDHGARQVDPRVLKAIDALQNLSEAWHGMASMCNEQSDLYGVHRNMTKFFQTENQKRMLQRSYSL